MTKEKLLNITRQLSILMISCRK